jgi:hypothetical protein
MAKMANIARTTPNNDNSLLRLSLVGGSIIGLLHIIIQIGIVFGLLFKFSFINSLQYIASGALGKYAFTGGILTAVIRAILELIMTIIIAGIFILIFGRISLPRGYIIASSLLYGIGVFLVMNYIVFPLSAAPKLPAPPKWLFIEIILEHMLLIALPLGILLRLNTRR